MSKYQHPVMKQLLDQQARFAPREARLVQVDRAEQLLAEIDSHKEYPYQYICYRITDFRSPKYPKLVLDGSQVQHDLRLFVADLSDSLDLSIDSVDEPVWTSEELSQLFNVSTKTISRWRERGLVGRRFVIDGRKRLGFLKSSVGRFVESYPESVRRGARFSHLAQDDRLEILRRARRMSRSGACLGEVSRRIAKKMGRSPETIRYTIRNHDRENPKQAVFPGQARPLDSESRREIFQQYRRGVSVEILAKRYCRTRSSIYRIINEVRARRLLEQPIEYMYNECFDAPDAEKVILAAPPAGDRKANRVKVPQGLPPYLASLYEVPLLNREEEAYLFRKMNFLKYRAHRLRERLQPHRSQSKLIDRIEKLVEEARQVKNQIIRANLRLVVSIAKRHVGPANNFFELVSDGNMSLIRAVEKFDYGRGNKFSTYASWAIMKNFARSIPVESHRRDRFRTGTEEMFEVAADTGTDQYEQEAGLKRMQHALGKILDRLDDRERQIIVSRFGLLHTEEPQTLEQVGTQFGVTKERIRQLEARALNKLRQYAAEEKIDVPGI